MPAHVFVPLLALGCLVLIAAGVAVLQPRVGWLRWAGAGLLLAALLAGLTIVFRGSP